jgi:DNA-binding winged helix-turn-helix (wHTH) protein
MMLLESQPHAQVRLAFGPFEVDTEAGVVFRSGIRVRLSGQPLRVLLELLANSGNVVTRDQLRDRIWAQGTFVDFERGMNAAINKLRRALRDSADNPRYIETVPGRGYRFIGTLERRAVSPAPPAVNPEIREELPTRVSVSFWWWAAPLAAILILLAASHLFWHSRGALPLPWKLVRLATREPLIGRATKKRF